LSGGFWLKIGTRKGMTSMKERDIFSLEEKIKQEEQEMLEKLREELDAIEAGGKKKIELRGNRSNFGQLSHGKIVYQSRD